MKMENLNLLQCMPKPLIEMTQCYKQLKCSRLSKVWTLGPLQTVMSLDGLTSCRDGLNSSWASHDSTAMACYSARPHKVCVAPGTSQACISLSYVCQHHTFEPRLPAMQSLHLLHLAANLPVRSHGSPLLLHPELLLAHHAMPSLKPRRSLTLHAAVACPLHPLHSSVGSAASLTPAKLTHPRWQQPGSRRPWKVSTANSPNSLPTSA